MMNETSSMVVDDIPLTMEIDVFDIGKPSLEAKLAFNEP